MMAMSRAAAATSAFLDFDAGDCKWQVPADAVREVHQDLSIHAVPGVASWFMGTALARGQIVAVSDFGAWLGKPGPVHRYLEFEAGFVLAVERVTTTATASASGERVRVDAKALLATPAFRDIAGPGGSLELVPSL